MTASIPITGDRDDRCVIVCRGIARFAMGDPRSPAAHLHGQYLRQYDPEYKNGLGRAWWTPNIDEARVYPDFMAAYREYGRISLIKPRREDGRANRPLTAFHIECTPLVRAQENARKARKDGPTRS